MLRLSSQSGAGGLHVAAEARSPAVLLVACLLSVLTPPVAGVLQTPSVQLDVVLATHSCSNVVPQHVTGCTGSVNNLFL